jgi:hypothetical protein
MPADPRIEDARVVVRRARGPAFGCTGAALIAAAACTTDGTPGVGMAARDSAGIEIVESRVPRVALGLADTASIELGRDEGGMTFHGVAGVAALEDGLFVVADNSSRELRFFDASGAHVRTVGGEGGGPGEYRFLSWVRRLPGDTIAVYDPRARRVSLITGSGSYVGAIEFRSPPATPPSDALSYIPAALVGLFADRSGLVAGEVVFRRGSTEGWQTVEGVMVRHDFESSRQDTIATIPLIDHYWAPGATRPSPGIFSARASWTPAGRGLLLTTGREYEVRRYDAAGSLQRISRAATAPRDVTAAHRAAHAASGPAMEGARYMDRLPAYSDLLLVGDDIWAVEFIAPGDSAAVVHMFDADGALTRAFELPAAFELHDARDGRAFGVHRDGLGVETVRVYRLSDAASAGTR